MMTISARGDARHRGYTLWIIAKYIASIQKR